MDVAVQRMKLILAELGVAGEICELPSAVPTAATREANPPYWTVACGPKLSIGNYGLDPVVI